MLAAISVCAFLVSQLGSPEAGASISAVFRGPGRIVDFGYVTFNVQQTPRAAVCLTDFPEFSISEEKTVRLSN
jgi:hypothetical protein